MNRPLDTLGARLKYARKQRKFSQEDLGARVAESQSTISKIENHAIQQTGAIARLAAALNVPPLWLELGHPPEPDWTNDQPANMGHMSKRVAHFVSPPKFEDAPDIVMGESMDPDKLPPVFWTAITDDAMAPRLPKGKKVCFDRTLTARAGDAVLVVDAAGALAVRQYRAAALGKWTAYAINDSFEPMDSQQHGLRVIAVLKAEEGRWT
jgi:transcriptional regulator with XRE-family HTH domain